jgi:hypothetical protein
VNGSDIAELQTNFTTGGSHPMVAVYSGDTAYASSTSSSLTESVDNLAATQAVATTVLTENHAAAAFTPVTGTGGTAPLSYSVAPTLPAGLSMASATGTITGAPTVTGPATSYTVTVTDANSATATATFSLTINQATPTIMWATPAAILYGTALSGTQLNASSSVAGTFTYSPATGTVLSGGSQTLTVTFTPTDTTDYTTATETVSLTVNQATPTITWATPAAITYGTALSATQLNATASVAGSFIYSPAAGTVLGGSQPLTATFTPTDKTDYAPATAMVTLTMSAQIVPALAFAPIPTQVAGAAPFAVNATSASSGAVTYAVLIGPATIAGNMVTVTGWGTVVLWASQAASGSYTAAVATTSFTVGLPFTLTTAAGSASGESASPGSVASFNLTLAPAGATTFTDPITFSVTGLPTGATASFSPATIAAGSAITPVTLSIQTANTQTAYNEQPTSGNPLAPEALGLLLLPLLGMRATRRRLRQMPRLPMVLLAVALSLGVVLGISGCSAGSVTPPAATTPASQTYTVVAIATDTTTKAQSMMNLTLTIQ